MNYNKSDGKFTVFPAVISKHQNAKGRNSDDASIVNDEVSSLEMIQIKKPPTTNKPDEIKLPKPKNQEKAEKKEKTEKQESTERAAKGEKAVKKSKITLQNKSFQSLARMNDFQQQLDSIDHLISLSYLTKNPSKLSLLQSP